MSIQQTTSTVATQEAYKPSSVTAYLNNKSENNLKINKDDNYGWTAAKFLAQKASYTLTFTVGLVETAVRSAATLAFGLILSPALLLGNETTRNFVAHLAADAKTSAASTAKAVSNFFSKNAQPAADVAPVQPAPAQQPAAPVAPQGRLAQLKALGQKGLDKAVAAGSYVKATAVAHPRVTKAVAALATIALYNYAMNKAGYTPIASSVRFVESYLPTRLVDARKATTDAVSYVASSAWDKTTYAGSYVTSPAQRLGSWAWSCVRHPVVTAISGKNRIVSTFWTPAPGTVEFGPITKETFNAEVDKCLKAALNTPGSYSNGCKARIA